MPNFTGFGITDVSQFNSHTFTIPPGVLPKQRIDGKIYAGGELRCRIVYGEIVNHGRFGLIQRCTRSPGVGQSIVVKRPRTPTHALAPEAFMQSMCSTVLWEAGFPFTVPRVFDIFVFADEVRYSMEWVEGSSILDFLLQLPPANFEEVFVNCVMQLCCILHTLETVLGFDHRDLKPDNLWVQTLAVPEIYRIQLGSGPAREFTIHHRIVLLDFGFSCVGSGAKMRVNLGDAIPDVDACPKAGRDMYHVLNSLITIPRIRAKLSATLLETIRGWMLPYTTHEPFLTHLLTADVSFAIEALKAERILQWFFLGAEASE